ncbi:MAG: stage III sporulation AC/AD family protein, partial [Clostridia bacterium]|nr:stage III sporulation AC/AD family protein [Clostridia bacterium]
GMIVAVLCQVLSKSGRDDQASLVSLAGVILILLFLVGKVGELVNALREVFGL